MTLSTESFLAAWGTLFLAHSAMLVPYWRKWQAHIADVGDDIRSYNARRGYGQSVGRERLAESYLTPFKSEALDQFTDDIDLSTSEYERQLREHIGKPVLPFIGVVYQAIAITLTVLGLTYFLEGTWVSAELYLFGLGFLFVVSVILYVIS